MANGVKVLQTVCTLMLFLSKKCTLNTLALEFMQFWILQSIKECKGFCSYTVILKLKLGHEKLHKLELAEFYPKAMLCYSSYFVSAFLPLPM